MTGSFTRFEASDLTTWRRGSVAFTLVSMAGADFIRADLHVHTFADSDADPAPDLDSYVDAALAAGLGVLGITDHNTVGFAAAAIKAASGKPLLVLPGIEVSTHDGHLLALFAPDALAELEAFAHPSNLSLSDISATEKRSPRSMLDLVQEIHRRGGLAIPAHVDAADGIHDKLKPAELIELLKSPALAGFEFAANAALCEWFTNNDPDPNRLAAWKARQKVDELRERGLARLMSSDAHSAEKVGQDRSLRTLTRLRLDDPNFEAVRNAILLNPKARCKAEAVLPASYPRIVSAEFSGGFLDGVKLEFSPNLNCLIGGRGSGKSTALLAIRSALGATISPEENADEPGRMPDETLVRFIDGAGSARTAVRRRGDEPLEPESASPIWLRLADLGQDESGRLARGYEESPEILLEFLDGFVVRHKYEEADSDLLVQLEDNAAEVTRTSGYAEQITKLETEHARLEASLKAAQTGKVETIAEWAGLLAAQAPLLTRLETELGIAAQGGDVPAPIDLDALATEFGVDLSRKPAKAFVEGTEGLRERLRELAEQRSVIRAKTIVELSEAVNPSREILEKWKADQADLETRLKAKQSELEAQGLKVQAGAVREIATRLNTVKSSLSELRKKRDEHQAALKARQILLSALYANRESLFQARRATLKRIADAANTYADRIVIRVFFEKRGINQTWVKWLTNTLGFRSPRVLRLAEKIGPAEFAGSLLNDRAALLDLRDDNGEPFFTEEMIISVRTWPHIFALQTMRPEDRPRIEVQEHGRSDPRPFDHLSAGEQRSILLSLILCAERYEHLVLDQPEDHLDSHYVASAVVRHLESAKERRQVLIATHSANLTVLGDAELVIPLRVEAGRGRPHDEGAVDRPATRDRVCALLEGGVEAYRKRGERYGFRFSASPE